MAEFIQRGQTEPPVLRRQKQRARMSSIDLQIKPSRRSRWSGEEKVSSRECDAVFRSYAGMTRIRCIKGSANRYLSANGAPLGMP